MIDTLTEKLLARQEAKFDANQFGSRVGTAADARGSFTASSNGALFSQGLGNLLGAVDAPNVRQAAIRDEAIAAEQTQFDRGLIQENARFRSNQAAQNQTNLERKFAREDRDNAKADARILAQNQFNIDTDSLLQRHVAAPAQQALQRNKALINQLPSTSYRVENGSIALTETATDEDREIFNQLQDTDTSFSDDALRKDANSLFDRHRKNAQKLGIPLELTRNDFIAKLTEASGQTINRVSAPSATEAADFARRAAEHQQTAKFQGELVDAEVNLLASADQTTIDQYRNLPTQEAKDRFLTETVIASSGAYTNQAQQMQSTLDQLQTAGVKTVEDLLTTFAAEGDDVSDILKSGGEFLREGLSAYNKSLGSTAGNPNRRGRPSRNAPEQTTGVSKRANLNDPLVLAAADRALKTVGLDRDFNHIGADADFNSDLKRAFISELGKLDIFRRAQEKKSKLQRDSSRAIVNQELLDTAITTGKLRKSK